MKTRLDRLVSSRNHASRLLPALLAGVVAALSVPALGTAASRATDVTAILPAPASSAAAAAASYAAQRPQLVAIDFRPGIDLGTLLRAGLDVVSEHAGSADVLLSPIDAERIARLGVSPRVLDADPGATAARRSRLELDARTAPPSTRVLSATSSDGRFTIQSLPPFGSGSMGGYWTAAEIKMKLDQLVASDTQSLVADKVDTVGYSREGRPIWGLRITKAIGGPDTRPVVFYNALTHVREPEGMQALFYYVDDVLAKYGSDPLATWLLDHRVLYIVPLVNPDGYAVNEAIYSGSGGSTFGFWRKNTRDNNHNGVFDAGTDGVDLNRNFGVDWGLNNVGSSPDSTTDTYRGPSPFSEAETQVQRDLVSSLKPVTGFSFHTYSDLLIHPWGYTTAPTLDNAAFTEWSDELTRDNALLSGSAPHILYEVNGDFNDWTYGDTLAKPRAFTWTPEIGSDADGGFWPPPSRITPLAQKMLRSCYVVAAIAGPYVIEDGVTLLEGAMNAGRLTNVVVKARNLGARGATGAMTGTLTALDTGAHVLNGTVSYPDAGPRTTVAPIGAGTFQVALDDSVTPGRRMRFEVLFTSSAGFGRDTIVALAGTPTVLFSDGASAGLANWTSLPGSSAWSVVQNDPAHPSRYFAEDGVNDYPISADERLMLKLRLNLSTGVHAYALYDAKWEFEQDYDAGAVEATFDSTVTSSWTQLNATGTTPGSGIAPSQAVGLPLYCGNRRNWKAEIADLSPWSGPGRTHVNFRFRGRSDGGGNFDGMAFDSLRIVIFNPAAQPTPVAVGGVPLPHYLELAAPSPNPTRGLTRFDFALPQAGLARLEILDLQGRRVRTLMNTTLAAGHYVHGWNLLDDRGVLAPPGVYLARLATPGGQVVRRVVVIG